MSSLVKGRSHPIVSNRISRTTFQEELSAHEYPREIEFRDELPKTATGKIRRTELQDEAEAEAEPDL
jgi:acetyl-CoA synthetase